MTGVALGRLGAYVLPGAAHDPASGIEQARATERMGLGTAGIGERYDTKHLGALAGAPPPATSRAQVGARAGPPPRPPAPDARRPRAHRRHPAPSVGRADGGVRRPARPVPAAPAARRAGRRAAAVAARRPRPPDAGPGRPLLRRRHPAPAAPAGR